MKKNLNAFLSLGGFCLSAIPKISNVRQANSFLFIKEESSGIKMNHIKSYEELNQQFTRFFGKNDMIFNPGVAAQLEKNSIKSIFKFKL